MGSQQVRLQNRRQLLGYGAVAQRSEARGDAVHNAMLIDDLLDDAPARRHPREGAVIELGGRAMPSDRLDIL